MEFKSDIVKWLVLGGIGLVFLLILLRIMGWINEWFGGNTLKVETPDISYTPTGGEVQLDFLPASYSIELRAILTTSTSVLNTRCEVLQRAYEDLNENELRAVYNDYKNRFDTTLKLDLQATWSSGCYLWQPDYRELLIDRLNKMEVV